MPHVLGSSCIVKSPDSGLGTGVVTGYNDFTGTFGCARPRISKISGMCAFHAFAKVVIRKIRAIRDFDQTFIYYLLK